MNSQHFTYTSTAPVLHIYMEQALEIYVVNEIKPELRALIDAEGLDTVLFHMERVPFVDSSALGMFMQLGMIEGRNLKLLFCGSNENIKLVFKYTNFTNLFGLFDTEAEALESLNTPSS